MIKPMIPRLIPVAVALVSSLAPAQTPTIDQIAPLLGFEQGEPGTFPKGWGGTTNSTVVADDKIVHGGRLSARIERTVESPGMFSSLTTRIPMDFTGRQIELRGFIRIENVSDYVGLWMREDGERPTLEFDNMQRRQVKGTADWTQYSITLPLNSQGKYLFFGFLFAGTGKAWVDDLQLLVDGKPIWEAPRVVRPKTPLETDQEFDQGSRVSITTLSPVQIENLATLGKVWGFLKYHHPAITSGTRHWDYDLFRVLPSILTAADHNAANAAMLAWVKGLGAVPPCSPCASLNTNDIHLRPDVAWIANQTLLGKDLSQSLGEIYDRRLAGKQFYVSLTPNVGNPSFERELGYGRVPARDAGFQLLAVYRYWNIIQYWFPNRDVLGEDWDKVLADFIPRVALASDAPSYHRELMALIARAHDTHSNLWSSLQDRPPVGACQVPVIVRFIEGQPVIASDESKDSAFRPGDVIEQLDGRPIADLTSAWSPYYADSNDAARERDIARSMTRGACGEMSARVRRQGQPVEIKATRRPPSQSDPSGATHDLPGDTFRLLSPEVGYLKLSSIKAADLPGFIDRAAKTKGLVIDIRNYPSEFVVFALGSMLVADRTPFVRFTSGDLSNPGAFHWTAPVSIDPQNLHYAGKVAILVDETSQSQAEYTTMAFRASPKAKVFGSMTAGADGNVSEFALPGGIGTMISGIGVFYPDKRPTQRVGIVPDVPVKPTIAGIRDGRDEVLETALRDILGPEVPAAKIREMIPH
jgi:C-terminal processing protease CtpA/Prc